MSLFHICQFFYIIFVENGNIKWFDMYHSGRQRLAPFSIIAFFLNCNFNNITAVTVTLENRLFYHDQRATTNLLSLCLLVIFCLKVVLQEHHQDRSWAVAETGGLYLSPWLWVLVWLWNVCFLLKWVFCDCLPGQRGRFCGTGIQSEGSLHRLCLQQNINVIPIKAC